MRKNKIPPDAYGILKILEDKFDNLQWNEIYDLFEFIFESTKKNDQLIKKIKKVLSEENIAYKILNGIFIEIESEHELKEIEEALKNSQPEVCEHLEKSADYLSPSKKRPDYRNSIKESISAVEALARSITHRDSATLSDILNSDNLGMHEALKQALKKIWGYTSDAPGVRHAKKPSKSAISTSEREEPKKEEAKFSLAVCSAYINLIKAKNSKNR